MKFHVFIPAAFTVKQALDWGTQCLAKTGLNDPGLEAGVLLSGIVGIQPALFRFQCGESLSDSEQRKFREAIQRRARFEPVAYIEGKKNFLGRELYVDSRVLVPRPETELLVEKAMEILRGQGWTQPRLLDVGTGSGCIALTLALEFPAARVWAVDPSEAALQVAEKNACSFGLENRIQLRRSEFYAGLGPEEAGFDMIISNPPYIAEFERNGLDPDLSFEPAQALFGGSDGLAVIRPLIKGSASFLKKGGFLILEVGRGQAADVRDWMRQAGFEQIQAWRDYSQVERMVTGIYRG